MVQESAIKIERVRVPSAYRQCPRRNLFGIGPASPTLGPIDTSILVCLVDGRDPVRRARAREFVERAALTGRCVLSVQNLGELVVVAARKGLATAATVQQAVDDLTVAFPVAADARPSLPPRGLAIGNSPLTRFRECAYTAPTTGLGGTPMTETPARAVREAWAAGRAARNAWLTIPDAHLAEMVAARGVTEAVTVDLQHGLFDQVSAVHAFRAVAAHGLAPMVRLPGIDAALAGYLLDAGAAGVIAPMVETVAEAEALVAACRYPPRGRRSHGPIRTALRPGADAFAAAEEAVVFAMIETADGLERCEAIAAVPGLDGLFIGPGDLGLALGSGAGQDRTEPELVAAFTRVLAACRSAGKHAGMHAATAGYAARMAAEGFDLVTVWVDAAAIGTSLTAAAETWARSAAASPR